MERSGCVVDGFFASCNKLVSLDDVVVPSKAFEGIEVPLFRISGYRETEMGFWWDHFGLQTFDFGIEDSITLNSASFSSSIAYETRTMGNTA
jgi:hypothetical protein